MEEFNLEKVEKTMEDTFSFIKARDLSLEIGKMFAINLMYHSNRIIREMDGTPSTALPYCNMACIEKQVTTMDELQRLLGEYVKEFFAYANELKERDAQNTIYRIEEYIKENFRRNLTIKEIAKVFYMHPAYIGQTFLKTFGVSFHEYLHQLRISEAKSLMEKEPVKIHEVAEEVGYNNYHSFLENFKNSPV
jgi:two-component system response regulator YesN